MKECRRCSGEKPLADFSPDAAGAQGRDAWCRACRAEAARRRRLNPETRAAQAAKQRERRKDPETAARDRAASRAWKKRNPDKIRAANRSPEKRLNNVAWNKANPAKRLAATLRYQAAHPEIGRVVQQRRRARLALVESTLTQAQWLQIVDDFNGLCAYCLRGDLPLQQEHMRPISKGGANAVGNVVPSCGPCNFKKHTRDLIQSLSA